MVWVSVYSFRSEKVASGRELIDLLLMFQEAIQKHVVMRSVLKNVPATEIIRKIYGFSKESQHIVFRRYSFKEKRKRRRICGLIFIYKSI